MERVRRTDPRYGRGSHTISSAELPADYATSAQVVRALQERFTSPGYQPPVLPAVALRVHQMASDGRSSIVEMAELIETDAFIAAGVLRLARSPRYATRVPPSTLKQAVSRLGAVTTRDLVYQVVTSGGMFRAPGLDRTVQELAQHGLVTGHFARLLAGKQGLGEHAFLFGLLHDVGLAAVLVALAEQSPRDPTKVLEWIVDDLEALHQLAGGIVTRAWEMPGELVVVASEHHAPTTKWSAVVRVAERVAIEHGFGVGLPDGSTERVSDDELRVACEILSMSDEMMERFRASATALIQS